MFYYSDGISPNQYSYRMYAYDLITRRAVRVGDKDGGESEGPFMFSGSSHVGTLPYIGAPSYDGSVAAVYMHGTAGRYLRVCDLTQSASIGTPVQARIGQTTQVPIYAPGQSNRAYLAGAALSTSPGIPLGSRYFPLAPDFLLSACWSSPGVFQGFFGSALDFNGKATPSITIPLIPGLVGISFATSFLTLDPLYPTGFGAIAPAAITTIVP